LNHIPDFAADGDAVNAVGATNWLRRYLGIGLKLLEIDFEIVGSHRHRLTVI